ncbi:MAG: conjugal transfer protein TraX [Bacteroidales bacterium]|nr:conjugal transfer protein TraX [Bacteroidales bacterium]MCM1416285.1 conjugal transfer protein TraX [bacterium]MCM1423482.1 conjugal transfer protein TraX [bacterium]
MLREKNSAPFSGAALKNIAYITMFIDHFFAVLFLNYMRLHLVDGGWDPRLMPVYRAGRAVGRIAFILFAFLIVEGFIRTRSRARFLLRLFLFALLSEIPFDLAFSGKLVEWKSQNVYWTLFLGVLLLAAWEYLSYNRRVLTVVVRMLILAAVCAAAFVGATDYRFMGILLILAFYLTRGKNAGIQFAAVALVMLLGTWGQNVIRYAGTYTAGYLFLTSRREMYGLFAFVPIFLYNGKRGKQLPKPFYYGFYPLHLLALYGIARMTGVM